VAATLKDVAAHAGVSIKTVSNVVHDHPRVAAQTRERVRTAIEALNYRPNLSARHLRKARVGVLALAIPDLANTYFSDIGNAVIAAAAARAYTVLLDHTGGDRANEILVANGLRPHLIDGVILSPLALEMDDLWPNRVAVPIVLLGEQLFSAPWDHIVIDNVAAARAATAHLLRLGRRRIATMGMRESSTGETARRRVRGYAEALAEVGRVLQPHLLAPVMSFHRADGARAKRQLLALDHRPDAVFCFNGLLALGALRALHIVEGTPLTGLAGR
jgi:DNA-binding LacI/PurR family transcriptional regulator